jgi:TRAP-type C4-dicarboxylate transport system permease small subunit
MSILDQAGRPSGNLNLPENRAVHPAVRILLTVERWLTEAVVASACLMLAAAACAGLHQVVSRFILQQPSTWSEVLVRVLLIWMVYLGAAGAIRTGALVSVDLLYRKTRGFARRSVEAAVTLCTLAILIILFWYGWDMVNRVRFQNMAGLEISMSWAYAAIPVGSAFGILAVIAHYFDPQRRELETAL